MITTAVLDLTTPPAREPDDPQWPFRRIGGLSLLERNLRALKVAKVTHVHVVTTAALEAPVRRHLDRLDQSRLPQVDLQVAHAPQPALNDAEAMTLNGRYVFPLAVAADTEQGRKEAGRQLRAALRKPSDHPLGFRPISISISRLLFPFPIHPNAITLLTIPVAIAAAWFSARGTYAGFVVGGLLFELGSLLDGVDGEIARMKFLFSSTGEWIDTICDDLSNAIYLTGVTLGVAHATGSSNWLIFGAATIATTIATVALMYWQLVTRLHARSLLAFEAELSSRPPTGIGPRLLAALEPCIKRPFYTFAFIVFTIVGHAELILIATCVAMTLTLSYLLWDLGRQRE